MPVAPAIVPPTVELAAAVLSKAAIRAADMLGLDERTLATIIGLSESAVADMRDGAFGLPRESKSFEWARCSSA